MKRARRTRRWVAAAAVAAAAWGMARGLEPREAETWVRVERRDLVLGIDVEGELQAASSADLGPPQVRGMWSFKLSFMAPEGREVREGERVLGFDTTELQQHLQEKIAERDSAIKELEKRATDFEIEHRDQVLALAEAEAQARRAELKLDVPEEVAKRRELEKARIDHRLAQLEIQHARASLEHLEARRRASLAALTEKRDRTAARVEEIESHLQAFSVKAPRPGTVIYKSDWRNNKKKIGDSCWRGETVIEIPDLARMLGKGEVAEADAGRLALGQSVVLYLDAYPGRRYRATVNKIRRAVQQKSLANPRKVVRLELELEETDTERMRPGMRFRGVIETGRLADTLVVPLKAVTPGPQGTSVTVRTLFGRREMFPELGERNAEAFAVVAGLEEGDQVLLRGGGAS